MAGNGTGSYAGRLTSLPSVIHPVSSTDMFGGSLYQAEEDMNQLEQDLVMELTALPNIRWWHRNIVRQGFAINGFINHYPDIMLMTNSGKVILVETKGDHLKTMTAVTKSKWAVHGAMQPEISIATTWCSGTGIICPVAQSA